LNLRLQQVGDLLSALWLPVKAGPASHWQRPEALHFGVGPKRNQLLTNTAGAVL